MVPYDRPGAALVRCFRDFECVQMLICPDCPGYDHPMGEERFPDGMVL